MSVLGSRSAVPGESCAHQVVNRIRARQSFDERHPVAEVAESVFYAGKQSPKPLRLTVENANGMSMG